MKQHSIFILSTHRIRVVLGMYSTAPSYVKCPSLRKRAHVFFLPPWLPHATRHILQAHPAIQYPASHITRNRDRTSCKDRRTGMYNYKIYYSRVLRNASERMGESPSTGGSTLIVIAPTVGIVEICWPELMYICKTGMHII
jgi:hypothetical protein